MSTKLLMAFVSIVSMLGVMLFGAVTSDVTNADSTTAEQSDTNVIVVIEDRAYLLPEGAYADCCEAAIAEATDPTSYDRILAICVENYAVTSIDGISDLLNAIASEDTNVTSESDGYIMAANYSRSNDGVTKTVNHDWGYKVYISGKDLSAIMSAGGVIAGGLALIPGIGQLGSVLLAVIGVSLSAVGLTDYVETGIVFDLNTAFVTHLWGHTIIIPHQPYVSNIHHQ